MTPRSLLAAALLRLGRRVRSRHLVLLDAAVGHLALGRWLAQRGVDGVCVVADRAALFELARPGLESGGALYVELGVHEGESMRWWSSHLANPDARLHGFDSFEGLPEAWNEDNPTGRFATAGVPVIADDRVRFFPGWFADTLPAYEPPTHTVLFVNFDADLYSSTITALRALRPLLVAGTWLYFDELNDRHHELRALDEFLVESGLDLEVVARAANGRQWLFRVC